MKALAVTFERPESLALRELTLTPATENDVVVDVDFTSISVGTERLLWTGRMPPFPGLGYPLVPGYESVGRIVSAGPAHASRIGETVFVPGANCYGEVRGLFGGAASTLVVPAARVATVDADLGAHAVLLALAATGYHALADSRDATLPDLIIGHGVFGRLTARLVIAMGGAAPTVWEKEPQRAAGALGYSVVTADADPRRDYACILDASGDASLVEPMIMRLRKGGEIVLAGFYPEPINFRFPLAFMKEARLRIAAEWNPDDLRAVTAMVHDGRLSLDGLFTHHEPATNARTAYDTAFGDPSCLKMILDWRDCA